MNNSRALLMWENSPDTPIDANNLSEAIDFQSFGKFIYFTNDREDYTSRAEKTLDMPWPNLELWDQDGLYLNKIIYNFYDNTVRRPIYDQDQERKVWEYLPKPYKKILKVKAGTKVSLQYRNVAKQKNENINFDFGDIDQIVTIDDILSATKDFKASTRYLVYLYTKHSYNIS